MKAVAAQELYAEPHRSGGELSVIEKSRPILSLCNENNPRPQADTVEDGIFSLVSASGGRFETCTVSGPTGHSLTAKFGILGDNATAVIDTDEANGLMLLGGEPRHPLSVTSYGTGELILAALNAGARRIIVALGASAANDGGLGLAQALGVRMGNIFGKEAEFGGAGLAGLATIDTSTLDQRLEQVPIEAACFNLTPLCGPRGASRLHGFQRGTSEESMLELDAYLSHFADLIRHQLGVEIKKVPGSGAGGGQGAALAALVNAPLRLLSEVMESELERFGASGKSVRAKQMVVARQ